MKEYYLRDLLRIKNGKDHKNIQDGVIPIYGSGGIMRFGNKYLYNKESILLPRKGTLSNIQFAKEPFWTVDTIYYTEINEHLADPYFLYCYLKILNLERLNSGTGVPSMTFDSYYNIKVNLPSLSIQYKISKLLFTIQRLIDLNNQVNDNLEQIAKTLYDYWFVQFDFPDKNGKPYKSSGGKMVWNEELKREIPAEWVVAKIDNIVDCNKWNAGSENCFEYINYLDTSSLTRNIINSIVRIYPKSTDVPSRAVRIVQKNDILISTVRPNQNHFGIIKKPLNNLIASSGFAHLRSKHKGLSNDLIYYFLTSDRTINRLQQIAESSVSAYPAISPNDILGLKFCLSKEENFFTRINSILETINTEISANHSENNELVTLRDWLIPMLMNGQVKID
ncbi:MAG: restriction endonuclease subunit S [Lacibacter sp.]